MRGLGMWKKLAHCSWEAWVCGRSLLIAHDRLGYVEEACSLLIVPSVNSQLVQEELDHISKWAANNNLALNVSKTKEMIVKRPHTKTDIPPVTPGVERVAFMNILGVMFQENMSFTMQVDRLVARGAQTMYALGTLKNHGLNKCALWEVTRATLLSRLTYASQAWWGMLDGAGRQRLQGIINRAVKRGFLPSTQPTIAEICDNADKCLFSAILKKSLSRTASFTATSQTGQE